MTAQTPAPAEIKSDTGSGSVFSQIFDSGPGSGSERKTQNPAGVDSANPDPVPSLVATQTQHSLSNKFTRNLGNIPKTSAHVLTTLSKYITGFLVKSFGECCGSTVFTAACYWPSVTVFLLRRLCPSRVS